MTDKQKKDIEWYERQLAKTKIMHNPENSTRPFLCYEYIKYAEAQLEAVKNGLSPFELEKNNMTQ